MRSALALAGLPWLRHRWLIAGIVSAFVALIMARRALPDEVAQSDYGICILTVPLGVILILVAYVFSNADLGTRGAASTFPSWMYTLPVRTSVLVAWPMFWSSAAVAVCWLAAVRWVFAPLGYDLPVWWPAFGLAASIGWLQAIDWSPLRIVPKLVAAVAILVPLWLILRPLMTPGYPTESRSLLALGFSPAAYASAVFAVSRVRHGSCQGDFSRRVGVRPSLLGWIRKQAPFRSPGQAQLWLEWRRTGILLPGLTACLLLFLCGLLCFVPRQEVTSILIMLHFAGFFLIAPLVGTVIGKVDIRRRQWELPPHAATLPLTSGELACAKLKAITLGLLLSWVILGVADVIWTSFGFEPAQRARWQEMWGDLIREHDALWVYSMVAAFVISVVGASGLQMLGHVYAGISGRRWVFVATLLFYLVAIPNLLVLDSWLQYHQPKIYAGYHDRITELAVMAVAVKLFAAALIGTTIWLDRLAGASFVLIVLGSWIAVVPCLFATLYQMYSGIPGLTAAHTPSVSFIFCVTVLALPLARILGIPLAVEYNRRR